MISRRISFRIRSESSPKTDRLNQVPFGSSGIAENPLRPGSWQESCGTLRTFVGLTPLQGGRFWGANPGFRCALPWAKFFDRSAAVAREPTSFPQSHLFRLAKLLQHRL